MNKASVIYTSAFGLLTLSLPIIAQPQNPPMCAQSKYDIAMDLRQKEAWFIDKSTLIRDKQNPFPGSYLYSYALTPPRRLDMEYVRLKESNYQAATDLLASRKLLLGYATNLIKNCPAIAIVSFGISNSGYWVNYYRFPNGSVRPRICMDDPGGPHGWGYGYCD